MKTNELIKLGNKREKPKYPLYYGKHKKQEFIVYDMAAAYLVKQGTNKQLRETTKDKKRIKKIKDLSKSMVGLLETNITSENIVSAEITDIHRFSKEGAEVVLIKSGSEERWVDIRFLSFFSPKRKALFDVSGWKNDIVFITETGVLVGFICTIKADCVISDSNQTC